jgi:murein DD-endopeptidase MepM/ murein hydrolase activator NlpD
MGRRPGAALLLIVTCLWALAAVAQEVPRYTVRKGDSLSLIAKRLGVTVSQIKGANGLSGDVIHAGQELAIPDALKRVKPAGVRWSRPVAKVGRTIRPFGNYQQGKLVMPSSGRDISCPPGTRVSAPAHGIVRHAGAMDGVGTVVIIEHGGGWTSVLAPLDAATLEARPGQVVLGGDHLALSAAPAAAAEEPYLHVELRKDNKAVAPDRLLK